MKTRITLDLSDEERLFAGIVSIAVGIYCGYVAA